MLDGKPIVAIATGVFGSKTENRKTGNMIQTWIIRRDMHPQIAVKTASKNKINGKTISNSYSVCGDCKHLHFKSCYVNLAHGPSNIFDAFHRGRYVSLDDNNIQEFKNRSLRIGSYGDPASIPTRIWGKLCKISSGWTGYTHQWENCDPDLKYMVMASVDTQKEHNRASTRGWRTFRVRLEGEEKNNDEMICPASIEAGQKTNCENCGACSGLYSKCSLNCTIIAHGGFSHMARSISLEKGLKKMKNKKKWRREFIEI